MSRLIYIANMRLPTEKAHGYQIMQMCEAFAANGHQVTLVIPARLNTPDLKNVANVWEYYGIKPNFKIVKLPCLDLIAFFSTSRLAFLLQTGTFLFSLLIWLMFQRYDILFSRDQFSMALLSRFVPRRKLIYEVHGKARSRKSRVFQNWVLKRVGRVVFLTGTMAQQLGYLGLKDVVIAHDGVNPVRFSQLIPNISQTIRGHFGIKKAAFVVCYAGRLHTMGMSKGLDVFVEAAAKVGQLVFLLAGGPAEQVEGLRQVWIQAGLPAQDFIAAGTVPPTEVPRYLAAADVCIITSPQNEFFANETSPMKLFEYMMAGKAIIASDLPSTREVVQHGVSAYLVPPSDSDALADALITLKENPELREQLGKQAARDVLTYTWQARAEKILEATTQNRYH